MKIRRFCKIILYHFWGEINFSGETGPGSGIYLAYNHPVTKTELTKKV